MSDHILDIKLFQSHATVTKNGSSVSKPVNIKDLISALSDSAANVFQYSRSEQVRLPEGAYLTEYAGDRLNLCLYFKERPVEVRHISSSKPKKYEIMLPNIVVHLVLRVLNNGAKHEVQGAYFYCTPKDLNELPSSIPGRLDGVFGHVPFPNFYDNFTMCTGYNTLINSVEGGDLRIFKMYYDIIADSPFNNDLRLYNVRYAYDSHKEWFEKLAEVYKAEQRFPYELVTI